MAAVALLVGFTEKQALGGLRALTDPWTKHVLESILWEKAWGPDFAGSRFQRDTEDVFCSGPSADSGLLATARAA